MAKQHFTVELDDETVRAMTVLGDPTELLVRFARSAADSVCYPGRPRRDQTDASLRIERHKADDALTKERDLLEQAADEIVRLARERADHVVHTARHDADIEHPPQSTAADASSQHERRRADSILDDERSSADALLRNERAESRREDRRSDSFLVVEREAMDKDLTGERADSDRLIVDQRDANQQLVIATIRSQELTVEAERARQRAEDSERKLREVSEFREMFIGMLGHDLRNPLASISMASQFLLARGHLDDPDAKKVSLILRNSERMSRMIMQLLDLTRVRLGGGLPIEPEPADLRVICQSVVEEFDATIQLEVAGDVTGTWDADRLAQVLSNLAGNALEYATPGTAVMVKAHADGAQAVVEVTNQGQPIPPDVLPFIFEPFRRARQQEKSSTGNLGLGLYIAHQIVLSHGGTLEAHSADGRTTFVMRLPHRC